MLLLPPSPCSLHIKLTFVFSGALVSSSKLSPSSRSLASCLGSERKLPSLSLSLVSRSSTSRTIFLPLSLSLLLDFLLLLSYHLCFCIQLSPYLSPSFILFFTHLPKLPTSHLSLPLLHHSSLLLLLPFHTLTPPLSLYLSQQSLLLSLLYAHWLCLPSSLALTQKMSKKRTRVDLPDGSSESVSTETQDFGQKQKRLHTAQDSAGSPLSQLSCISVCGTPLSGEEPVSTCLEEEVVVTSAALQSPEGIDGRSLSQCIQEGGWGDLSTEAADSNNGSCLASHEAQSQDYSSSGADGFDRSQEQLLRRTFSQAAESCSGDDNQVDINCFLENWDDDVGALAFNPTELFVQSTSDLPSNIAGCSDSVSMPGADGWRASDGPIADGDWFFGDLECDGQILWNEALDQEWMTAAVANLDRVTDGFDADASMLHLLEAGSGI